MKNRYSFTNEQINHFFPFFFLLNEKLEIIDSGKSFQKLYGSDHISFLTDFSIVRPSVTLAAFEDFIAIQTQFVLLKCNNANDIVLRGKFEIDNQDKEILFVGNPWFDSVEQIKQNKLTIKDFATHDPIIELLHIIKNQELVNEDIKELLNKVSLQKNELDKTNTRLSALISNFHKAILLENESRKITLVNQDFCNYFGIPLKPQELIGYDCSKSAEESMHLFKNQEVFLKRINQILQEKVLVQNEELELIDGRFFSRDFIPIYYDSKYQGHLWVYNDITDVRKEKEQLKLFKTLFDSSSDAIQISDEQGILIYINKTASERLGISVDKCKEYNVKDFEAIFQEDGAWEKHIESLKSVDYMTLEGENINLITNVHFPVEVNVSYVTINNKGYVVANSRDITERKKSETLLRLSEKRYKDLINNSQALIITHSLDGIINSVNPAVCDLLKYSEKDLVGNNLLKFIPESYREAFHQNYLKGFPENKNIEGEFKIQDSEKNQLYILFKNYLYEEEAKEPEIICFAQNITRRKIAEKELKYAKQITEDIAHNKQMFLANMSHEIRTPLNGITGIINLLGKTTLSGEQQKYIDILQDSLDHLIFIVNQILELEKIVAGKTEFEYSDFNLYDRLKKTINSFQYRAIENNNELLLEFEADKKLELYGDSYVLNQVLSNLISNALKFTSNGKVKLLVTTTTSQGYCNVTFVVSDTGIGIENSKIEKIFEPFSQENPDTSRKFGGTGLGLSIVKSLVAQLSGSIQVKSDTGVGTVFTVSIPYKLSDKLKEDEKNIVVKKQFNHLYVLVAEDVQLNQFLISKFLSNMGINYDIVNNGNEVLEKIKNNTYDCILMDIQMPELDGLEATKLIRNSGLTIPIIALTANVIKSNVQKYLKAGMNDFLPKPFTEENLSLVLDKLFSNQELVSVSENLYDLTLLESVSNGDKEFIRSMLALFVETIPESVREFRYLEMLKDYSELAKKAHKIKPTIDSMCIYKAQDLISELEKNADGKKSEKEISVMVDDLCTILEKVKVMVEAEIK